MNSIVKIKSLLLLFCLFISADALLSTHLHKHCHSQQFGEYNYFSLSTFKESGTEASITHAKWQNSSIALADFTQSTTPLTTLQYKSGNSSNDHSRKIKKHRRTRAVQSTCLLITPLFFQFSPLVHSAPKEYTTFFQHRKLLHEYYVSSLRGPPATA
jgi:hypothetical protein